MTLPKLFHTFIKHDATPVSIQHSNIHMFQLYFFHHHYYIETTPLHLFEHNSIFSVAIFFLFKYFECTAKT